MLPRRASATPQSSICVPGFADTMAGEAVKDGLVVDYEGFARGVSG